MVELIAEVATGHGGSVGRAIQYIKRFAGAGANILKFQYTRHQRLKPTDPQYEWFKQAELSDRDFDDLADYCASLHNVGFMLTVYHQDDVKAVRDLTPFVKVGSGEAHSTKLAEAILGADFHRVYVSGGIRPTNELYGHAAMSHVRRLACVSRYPHPSTLVPARLLETFSDGWSDHCVGLDGCMAAITLGATIIEKHVQIREQARPCQPWEATVEEFRYLREWADLDPDRFLGRWEN